MTLDQLKAVLALNLQFMRASEDLLAVAIQVSAGELRAYFEEHLQEEQGHAKWLAEDLDGFELPLNAICVAMAGSAYYLIKHVSPVCLLGYMLALETPMPLPEIEKLEAEFGGKLLRTARHHAVADQGHMQDLLDLIAKQSKEDRLHIARTYEWTKAYTQQINAFAQGK